MKKSTGQNFVTGAFILIFANALVKVIGAIYKLPLSNLIGKEGMGIFSVAYNIYTALFVLSTAGLPVAVSKMVSEANALGRVAEVKKIFRVALTVFTIIGIICTGTLMIFARRFTIIVKNQMAFYPVLAIAPSLFFMAIISTIRGYYQGLSNMVPTAISQVIEAMGKLFIGLFLAWILLKKGYPIEIGVAGAIIGVTIGTAVSAAYLIIKRAREPIVIPFRSDSLQTRSSRRILGDIVRIALPVTIGSSVLSLTNLIDMFVVLGRLQDAGWTEEGANALYGAYNMALTLFNLPQTLVVAVSISILPAISAAYARANYDEAAKTTESALRLTAIMALPCAVGLFTLSEPIMKLLYIKRIDDAVLGAPMLTILSIAVIFVAMVSLTNSILQGTGHINIPVITMLIGGIVKLTVNYILVGMKSVNIHGAPIGTTACYSVISILNMIYIIRNSKMDIKISRIFLRPLISAGVMGVITFVCFRLISGAAGWVVGVILSIIIAVPVYFVLLFVFKGFTKDDILLLPKGDRLAKLLKMN